MREIERKSKCRIQVTRTEEDLNRGFGEGGPEWKEKKEAEGKELAIKRDAAFKQAMRQAKKNAEMEEREEREKAGGDAKGEDKDKDKEKAPKMVTVWLFGAADACDLAKELIEEAVENRAQKEKNR